LLGGLLTAHGQWLVPHLAARLVSDRLNEIERVERWRHETIARLAGHDL
jgi:hypothetical protein